MTKAIRSGNQSAALNNFFGSFAQEQKLTLYGLFLLICFLMSFAYAGTFFWNGDKILEASRRSVRDLLLNLGSNIMGAFNPFGLILVSGVLREKMTEFFLGKNADISALGK